MTHTRRVAAVGAVVAAGLAIAALAGVGRPDAAHGQTAAPPTRGITVTGNGSVKAAPDRADFSFGVETQGETSEQALERNNEAVQEVTDAIKSAGLAASDIQTQQVSVSPRYSMDGQKIIGYSATNSVNAKVHDLATAGAVVEAAVGAGANQVYGPTFSIADQTELYSSALEDALADAKTKAQALASSAGVSIGPVITIVEGSSFGPPVPVAEAQAQEGGAVPIEPGIQEIVATVTVTYEIS
jgi:uncharacterized protein YggE